ncbi:MAG: cytochrome c biogenesis protein CcsA [Alphaproteobacteria bacterium]|nr:cytochrome c biogenesis protein CcsA [Alphaproteobacteria bacterium]MDD9920156.1 cytochrome c biogenesis protein CcsA [Alphaproteobacteria bacterium]
MTRLLVLLLFSLLGFSAFANDLDMRKFGQIPILHEGRIKPLDTFARHWLVSVSGKNTYEGGTANKWLVELLFDPHRAYQRPVFNIANPQIVELLGLKWSLKHRYSFFQVSLGLRQQIETINELYQIPEQDLDPMQRQLLDIYLNSLWFFDISRSLSLVLPEFYVENEDVAAKLSVPHKAAFSYIEMVQKQRVLAELVAGIDGAKTPEELTDEEKLLLGLGETLRKLAKDSRTTVLRAVPPQWEREEWLSPWAVLEEGAGSPQTAVYLKVWGELAKAWVEQNVAGWEKHSEQAYKIALNMSGKDGVKVRLQAEYWYNTFSPFKVSCVLYLAVLVCLFFAAFLWRRKAIFVACLLLVSGGVMHLIGLALRVFIMQRPPVATLYESILFVGFVGVLLALFLEVRRKDGVGIFIGAVLGAFLQFLSMRYAASGDSMGMLVAVLNTNFWLATHVVTITMGYGACLVASILGHVYLVRCCFTSSRNALNDLMKSMLGVSLLALFLTLLGTILGGIWADQSWGRFWGWDPKENGALFIVLWLLWLLHGRLTGLINPLAFSVGMVLTNIVVALAWFGVNLLGVGLHSYGFTENIAHNLLLFCGLEISFVVFVLGFIWLRKHRYEG